MVRNSRQTQIHSHNVIKHLLICLSFLRWHILRIVWPLILMRIIKFHAKYRASNYCKGNGKINSVNVKFFYIYIIAFDKVATVFNEFFPHWMLLNVLWHLPHSFFLTHRLEFVANFAKFPRILNERFFLGRYASFLYFN